MPNNSSELSQSENNNEINFQNIPSPGQPQGKHHQMQQTLLNFEKNYPKNIFIIMLAYCDSTGHRKDYQNSVGRRCQFETKNVVSLNLIHQLLTCQWFENSVTKQFLLIVLCNKILLNSKIKKKLFHIEVAKKILTMQVQTAKQFKKTISQQANNIAKTIKENHPLFQHSSATLYLLHLFQNNLRNCLTDYDSTLLLNSELTQSIQNDSDSVPSSKQGSKQQYKKLLKKIIAIFNKNHHNTQKIMDSKEHVVLAIRESQRELKDMYGLGDDVPGWQHFIEVVINNCYTFYKHKNKINNLIINAWIDQFKKHITTPKEQHNLPRNPNEQHNLPRNPNEQHNLSHNLNEQHNKPHNLLRNPNSYQSSIQQLKSLKSLKFSQQTNFSQKHIFAPILLVTPTSP